MQRISVGDRVRVREWDDMAAEFGYAEHRRDGSPYAEPGRRIIDTPLRFTEAYQYLCGAEATVVGFYTSEYSRRRECLLDEWNVGLKGEAHIGVESLELVAKREFDESLFYEALGVR